jgi:hypothetical protein
MAARKSAVSRFCGIVRECKRIGTILGLGRHFGREMKIGGRTDGQEGWDLLALLWLQR